MNTKPYKVSTFYVNLHNQIFKKIQLAEKYVTTSPFGYQLTSRNWARCDENVPTRCKII